MDKAFMIQKQARNNVQDYQSYLTDLKNWESEMKRKEAALNGEFEQDLPPVRSKVKKETPLVTPKKQEKRIPASDYTAWEKFDVDKACEELDMADIGPSSLDSKKSQTVKQGKLREEAQYEKEKGNNFVKQEKWTEAIGCYNRAIELVKDDAIYYANRGLCHLKKESLHQAESDCTEAIRLDPTYVKAYQRRATAREKLGSLRAASKDLEEILKLEPHNLASRKQLQAIRARMGTKGMNSKFSPISTPTLETKSIAQQKTKESKNVVVKETTALDKWMEGIGENITVLKTVKKPPHLRSKRALKQVSIKEIKLGEKEPTRMKIIEISDSDEKINNNNVNNKDMNKKIIHKDIGDGDKTKFEKAPKLNGLDSPESKKLIDDLKLTEKVIYNKDNMVPPHNSVQFITQWKCFKDNYDAKSDYLSVIDPAKIPAIFANALESYTLSDIIVTLEKDPVRFKIKTAAYLKALTQVKRFSALAMFLSDKDKILLNKLLEKCKLDGSTVEEISELKNKFEL